MIRFPQALRAPDSETGSAPAETGSAPAALPPDALIVLPVRNMVLFPGMMLPVTIGRPGSIAAAQQAVREQRPIGLLLQRDAGGRRSRPADLHRVGTVANIVRYVTAPDGSHHLDLPGRAALPRRSSS